MKTVRMVYKSINGPGCHLPHRHVFITVDFIKRLQGTKAELEIPMCKSAYVQNLLSYRGSTPGPRRRKRGTGGLKLGRNR